MRASNTATLEQRLQALMNAFAVPGLALAVIRQNQIAYVVGFGVTDLSRATPVLPETVFEAASLSKPIVAYAALQLCAQELCAQGLLELDTPLISLLGNQPARDAQLQGVTLRHVLSHTSGLPNWLADGEAMRTHFAPGSRFSYSGVGYGVLQSVIEAITGQPLAPYVERHVLRPLSMNDSSFIWRPDFDARCATGHDPQCQPVQKLHPLEPQAAFSLHSTAPDLARFLIATLRADDFVAQAMLTAQVAVGDSASWHSDWPRTDIQTFAGVFWGLGWGLELTPQGRCCWQWGDNPGFKAFALGSLETGDGFVALANSANGDRLWAGLAREFLPGPHPALEWLARISSDSEKVVSSDF